MVTTLPEEGQLVRMRCRQWIVTDVRQSAVPSNHTSREEHLVTLTSLDEDSFDEILSVVWELEPGSRVLPTIGLPNVNGWDTCDRLEAFLDAVRWGATTHADRSFLQAPFHSGVEIEDYQLDPLVRAIDMSRANLLIADDVGLGKTIEAGLVIQEFIVRHRARTVFIVCPASLQVKWQMEMHEKFGLEFRIVDTDYIKKLRRKRGIHANPWTSFPRLITSMDWAKSGEGFRLIKDVLPTYVTYPRKFDILVVDEAHNVAPSAAGRYAMPSQRTKLIRALSPHFEHKLFLSATPHNGYQESFTSLLELLDDQRFARGVMPEEKQLQRIMIRRLKSNLVDENGDPIYPNRELLALPVKYTDEEQEVHGLLQAYTMSRSKSVAGTPASFGTEFIHKLLKKRLFSSPMAFALTLAKHKRTLAKGHSKRDKRSMKERILRKAILRCEEDYASDAQVEESQSQAVEVATELSVPLTDIQSKIIDQLTMWAERTKNCSDSKAKAILVWLDQHLKADGKLNGKRVILFTEYRATHSWLMEILASNGWGGEKLMVLHGGIDPEDREKIKAAFQTHPEKSSVRILLATDAASEGIDLQNYCNYLIHIEIPWNPNVMEQRNGRIDRHGQKKKSVFIWHPVGSSSQGNRSVDAKPGDLTGDQEFLMRAVRKVDAIRQDLGCVGSVIAQQIEEAMLGKRSEMDTREAEAKAAKARKLITTERKLQEKIVRLHERLMEARNGFQLTPERIARAVSVALKLAGKPALKLLSSSRYPEGSVFHVPLLTGSWDQATYGLLHPHTGIRRPITFDHDVAQGRDDIVLAHLEHRLVRMSLRLLREEIWKQSELASLNRVAVRTVKANMIQQPVVIVWSRLMITGGGHHKLHEEVTLAGGDLKMDGFARIRTLGRLEELLAASDPAEPGDDVFAVLGERFKKHQPAILKAVEARSRERLEFLSNTLERRCKQEKKDLNQVLDDLETMIESELADNDKHRQMEFEFSKPDEREQIRRDLEALRYRHSQIPDERKCELVAIERRYGDLADRTFPVAVEFLIPEDFVGEC